MVIIKMKKLKRIYFIYLLLFVVALFVTMVVVDDKSNLGEAEYLELCNIYDSVVNKSISLSLKEMELTEKVQINLPELFDNLFVHIIYADSNKRYKLIKEYAKQQNNIVWSCESANKYYSDNFN